VDSNEKMAENSDTKKLLKPISTQQFISIIKVLHQTLNLETVRFTGGEPTLFKDLEELIHEVKQIGIPNIKMTSNGILLEKKANALKKAGLSSINISLDALDSNASLKINKRNKLNKILLGIEKSLEAGIIVKLNCVVVKGENDHQILELLDYAISKNTPIRYLELMQMGHLYHNFEQFFLSENEILETISSKYKFQYLPRENSSTTKYFQLENGFQFGIISNVSDPFCNDCNRLRLDSYGNIYGCLSENEPINILGSLNDLTALKTNLQSALVQKKTKFFGSKLSMLNIGG
jgi:cyclic pyranopterin phosphate synthase